MVPSLQADECIPFSLSCLSCFVRLFREFGKKKNEKNEWSRWGDKKIWISFLAKGRFFSRMEEQWKEEEKFLLRKNLSNGVYFGASLLIANFTLEMIELILCHFLSVATG